MADYLNFGYKEPKSAFVKRKITKKGLHEPKTFLGEYFVHYFIPKYENNVIALVYLGAAILVIVVGLRGIGTAVEGTFVPDFMLQDFEGGKKLSTNLVLGALVLEFFMIFLLSMVMFFTPEKNGRGVDPPGSGIKNKLQALIQVRSYIKGESDDFKIAEDKKSDLLKFIGYLDKFIDREEGLSPIPGPKVKNAENPPGLSSDTEK